MDFEAQIDKLRVLCSTKKYKRAIAYGETLLAKDPVNSKVIGLLTSCYQAVEDFEKMRVSALTLIDLEPDNDLCHYFLSIALIESDLVSALKSASDAVNIDGSNPRNHTLYGRLLRLAKREKESLDALDKALSIDSRYDWALREKAMTESKIRKTDSAINHAEEALSISPDIYENHAVGAISLFNNKQYDEAFSSLKEAIKLNPEREALRELYPKFLKATADFLGFSSRYCYYRVSWSNAEQIGYIPFFLSFLVYRGIWVTPLTIWAWYLDFFKDVLILLDKKHRSYLSKKVLRIYTVNVFLVAGSLVTIYFGLKGNSTIHNLGILLLIAPVIIRLFGIVLKTTSGRVFLSTLILAAICVTSLNLIGFGTIGLIFSVFLAFCYNLNFLK